MEINKIRVDVERCKSDAVLLETEITAIEAQIDALYRSISELEKMWEGPGKDTWTVQLRENRNNIESLCGTVHELARDMENAAKQYVIAEDEIRRIVFAL